MRSTQDHGVTQTSVLYDSFADLLLERAEMRRLWQKREADHVFHELESSQRPLPAPFVFGVVVEGKRDQDCALSPMLGMPEDLRSLADNVRAWGRACVSGNPSDLPTLPMTDSAQTKKAAVTEKIAASSDPSSTNEHNMPFTWEGWGKCAFGLEMQSPWAGLLLEGKKTIETRAYDLPPALLGRRIDILQSNKGGTVSSLGNVVSIDETEDEAVIKRVGACTFTKVIQYTDKESFEADEAAHRVKRGSSFGWKEGITKVIYGWVVGESFGKASQEDLKSIVRRHRSLFELRVGESKISTSPKKKKKRKRY